jgi:RHS repeat-associated protein
MYVRKGMDENGFCGVSGGFFLTDNNDDCPDTIMGYVRPGEIDKPRNRVTTATTSDGRGWSSTMSYVYYNPAVFMDATLVPPTQLFRGHAKVRAIDPLGNYTDTWFYQDELKKGRAYQTEVRNSAGALFNKTVKTFLTTAPFASPYAGVTFVRLDEIDYFECEGQGTCHQNAEKFIYDNAINGNVAQQVDLGDSGATGDERTTITDWLVDTTKWIHRPKRVALLDNAGATVRERWMYYDNAGYGVLGTRGLATKAESRLGGAQGNAGNPTVISGYDLYGNATSVTDARGCTTTTTFEGSQTYPATVINCLSHSSTMVYDARFGVMTSQIDANGQTTTSAYDELGRPTKVTGPLDTGSTYGSVSTFYDDWGNPNLQKVRTYRTEQHGTANFIWSEAYFDGLGRGYKNQSEGPAGQTIVSETLFDSRGLQWKTSAPRFTGETAVWTETLYDVLGRQIRVNFPDGTYAQTAYDHHEVIVTDPRGKVKITNTDSHHRVSQVEEINGGTSYFTNYEYDAADSLVKVTNAAGHKTHNVYDSLGRKVAMCDPNMGTLSTLTTCTTTTAGAWVYTYNLAGDMLTQKDAKNQTLTFTYDSLGRPVTKKQGTTNLVTWTYVAVLYSKGRVTKIEDHPITTVTTFSYDQMGRTTQTTRTQLGVPRVMSQTYDALSRITSETFPQPDNETVTYNYNTAGWLQSVTASSGPNYVNDIQYNARGQKTSLTYGNGLITTWTHNANNFRVTNRTTSNNQQNLTYGYDNNGNVTSITDGLFTGSRSFTYDDLNRMITGNGTFGVNQAQTNCSYAYTSIGNLTDKCGAVLSYGDANHPSAVTNHSTLSKNYTYDANGNMLTRGNQTLTWTVDNRVANIAIAGGGTTYMEYDYSGMRVKKTAAGGITLYPFAGYEIDPNGVITKFIRVGGETVASKKRTAGGTTTQYFYHNDHLGSVNVITDITQMRVQLNEYDPWGTVSRTSGTIDPDTRFTGQKLDPETGLYYYGGRYYDNEIGRFVSADPFVQAPYDPQNLNRYSYVVNSPQNYVDPDGYFHRHKQKSSFLVVSWDFLLEW